MIYQFLRTTELGEKIFCRIDDDGLVRVTCSEDNPEFQDWLAEGNEPSLPEEVPLTWDDIRTKRDQLIKDSDWTALPDATVNQAAWAQYRQILRDLPQTYAATGPESVVWPEPPSTTGPNAEEE